MKKVLLIILGLLCTFSAFAIGYATPYKGSTHSGYMHMTSSAQVHSIGSGGGGLAQAPTASMRSTSSSTSRVVGSTSVATPSIPAVQGIRTSASNIRGGVTATTTYAHMGATGMRKNTVPGYPDACEHCNWVWVDNLYGPGRGGYVCSECECELKDDCDCDPCHCDVPITDGKEVWLYMGALAAAYAAYKTLKKKETSSI